MTGQLHSPPPAPPHPIPHLEQLLWQVPPIVDATVHGNEALGCGFVLDVGVVQAGVQHDDSEGEHVAGIYRGRGESAARQGPGQRGQAGTHLWTGRRRGCTGSTAERRPPSSGQSSVPPRAAGSSTGTAWEERGVALLWGFTHPLAPQQSPWAMLSPLCSPQGLHEVEVSELVQLHEGVQDLDVELVPVGTKPEHEGCMISKHCDC